MRIPEELEGILTADPEHLSGAVRFVGTRVPLQALLDTLANKQPVSDFLEGFPSVTAEQVDAFLQWERNQARGAITLTPEQMASVEQGLEDVRSGRVYTPDQVRGHFQKKFEEGESPQVN